MVLASKLPEQDGTVAAAAGLPPSVDACLPFLRGKFAGPGAVRRIGEDTLCYGGAVDAEGARALVAALNAIPTDQPVHLVARSIGGDMGPGLDIAEALAPRQVTTAASIFCASACANYMLAPADRRVVLPDTLVLWHGGINALMIEGKAFHLARERSKPRPDRRVVATLSEAVEQGPGFLARDTALLRSLGVAPDFYSYAGKKLLRAAGNCTGGRFERGDYLLLYSDALLREQGVTIHLNQGVRSAEALLARHPSGLAGNGICFVTGFEPNSSGALQIR